MAALAYPDRIALRRPGDAPRWLMSGGKGVKMDAGDPLASSRLLVVTDTDGDLREGKPTPLLARALAAASSAQRSVLERVGEAGPGPGQFLRPRRVARRGDHQDGHPVQAGIGRDAADQLAAVDEELEAIDSALQDAREETHITSIEELEAEAEVVAEAEAETPAEEDEETSEE